MKVKELLETLDVTAHVVFSCNAKYTKLGIAHHYLEQYKDSAIMEQDVECIIPATLSEFAGEPYVGGNSLSVVIIVVKEL